jgi:hypothetical protein
LAAAHAWLIPAEEAVQLASLLIPQVSAGGGLQRRDL